jgi:hypothetical protein
MLKWRELKPAVSRVLDAIKADGDIATLTDVKLRTKSISVVLPKTSVAKDVTTLKTVSEELSVSAKLTKDEGKALRRWGVLVRKKIEADWRNYQDTKEGGNDEVVDNAISDIMLVLEAKGLSTESAKNKCYERACLAYETAAITIKEVV